MRHCKRRTRKKTKGAKGSRLLLPFVFLLFCVYFFYSRVSETVLFAVEGHRGVQFRQLHHRWSRVSLLDVDLACPGVRVEVAAADATRRASGCSDGAAHTVADWCRSTGAVAGINGGFFGRDLAAGRKEIVGLMKLDGELYARAPRYRVRHGASGVGRSAGGELGRVAEAPLETESQPTEAEPPTPNAQRPTPYYAHSAFGFGRDGRPKIDWVVSDPRRPSRLLAFDHPEGLRSGLPWEVQSGVSGGPRLIARSQIRVSDRSERLASHGLLPRTFIGYASQDGAPRHLVLAVATAMTFEDAARFLDRYFRRFHGLPCEEAMGLDGGPSSQLVYREGGVLVEAQSSDVTVPTCLLVHTDDSEALMAVAHSSPNRREERR
jgi:hypothetical protein